MTDYEKMLASQPYNCMAPELDLLRRETARLYRRFNRSDEEDEQLALLQQIIDQLPMNIFCRDTAGRYLFANKAFAREAGLQQPSDLVGKTDAEMPWGDQFREEDGRLLAEGKPLLHQQWHCHSGANTNWMEIHKVPLYDEQGDPLALFAMVSAIDQRKELEQTFRQQQLLQRRLLDAIPDPIRLEDHQGLLIDCNQAFLDFMGLSASDALGRRVPPRLPVEQTLGQGEYCVVDAQGKGRHLEVTRVEVPDDEVDGNSFATVGTVVEFVTRLSARRGG